MATSPSGRPKMMVAVRRVMASSVSALIATVSLASSAMADRAPGFNFNDDGSSGTAALSQPYSGPTPSGQSSGTGVAMRASDPVRRSPACGSPTPMSVCVLAGAASRRAVAPSRPAPRPPVPWGRTPSCGVPATGRSTPRLATAATSARFPPATTRTTRSTVCASIPAPPISSSSDRRALPAARRQSSNA